MFSIFKSEIDREYSKFNPGKVNMLFPGGKQQFANVILAFKNTINLPIPISDFAKLYVDTMSRHATGMSTPQMKRSISNKHPEIVTNQNAYSIIAIVALCMQHPDFDYNNPRFTKLVDVLIKYYYEVEENTKKNDEIFSSGIFGLDYGITCANPIFVNGRFGIEEYLSELRSPSGESFNRERVNTCTSDNINGITDVYRLVTKTIILTPYYILICIHQRIPKQYHLH